MGKPGRRSLSPFRVHPLPAFLFLWGPIRSRRLKCSPSSDAMSAEQASYLDSSALVKLAVREPESTALRRYIRRRRPLVASALARTEVTRALLPLGPDAVRRGHEVLARVDLVRVNVYWSDVESHEGVFNWSAYDPAIKGLHTRGIEPVLTLVSTPAWANGGRGTNWVPTSVTFRDCEESGTIRKANV